MKESEKLKRRFEDAVSQKRPFAFQGDIDILERICKDAITALEKSEEECDKANARLDKALDKILKEEGKR